MVVSGECSFFDGHGHDLLLQDGLFESHSVHSGCEPQRFLRFVDLVVGQLPQHRFPYEAEDFHSAIKRVEEVCIFWKCN